MSEEKFSGVDTLIERMGTHPEEFFESSEKRGRWAFMYKDYFKDCMTESEKGRIHEALKRVRRLEFDAMVVKELMKEEVETEELVKAAGLQPAPKKVLMNPSQIATVKQQVQSAPSFRTKLQQSFLKSQSDEVLGKKP